MVTMELRHILSSAGYFQYNLGKYDWKRTSAKLEMGILLNTTVFTDISLIVQLMIILQFTFQFRSYWKSILHFKSCHEMWKLNQGEICTNNLKLSNLEVSKTITTTILSIFVRLIVACKKHKSHPSKIEILIFRNI